MRNENPVSGIQAACVALVVTAITVGFAVGLGVMTDTPMSWAFIGVVAVITGLVNGCIAVFVVTST